MEHIFALLRQLKDETIVEVAHPAEDKRSEFHYGRVHGILFCLAWLDERLRNDIEENARRQDRIEREF